MFIASFAHIFFHGSLGVAVLCTLSRTVSNELAQ